MAAKIKRLQDESSPSVAHENRLASVLQGILRFGQIVFWTSIQTTQHAMISR